MIDQRIIVGIVTQIRPRGAIHAATIVPLAVSSADHSRWEVDLTTGPKHTTEFPNAGKVSWLHPDSSIHEGCLYEFSVREQPSYDEAPHESNRDRYMVDPTSVLPCYPILDFSKPTEETTGRQILTQTGLLLADDLPHEYIVRIEGNLWCQVKLVANDEEGDNVYTMPVGNGGMTRWTEWTPEFEPFQLTCNHRYLHTPIPWQLLAPGNSPQGPPRLRDWSSDAQVLQRVLRDLRSKCDPIFAEKIGVTKDAVSHITSVLTNGSTDVSNPGMELARLKRVTEFIKSIESSEEAERVALAVIEDSPITDVIEENKREILSKERKLAKTRAEEEIDREEAELVSTRNLLRDEQEKLQELKAEYESVKHQREQQITDLEQHLSERLASVLADAEEVVSSSVLIRAITDMNRHCSSIVGEHLTRALPIAETINERETALNRIRHGMSEHQVPFHLAAPLLAGFAGGVVPLLSGHTAYSALSVFANRVTGGSINWIPVSPSWIEPADFVGQPLGMNRNHPCGLLELLIAARQSDSLHLVVLDGINVAPCDTYLMPLLACYSAASGASRVTRSLPVIDAGDPKRSRIEWPKNVLLAGITHPSGAFPLPSELWASAIYVCCDAIDDISMVVRGESHPDKLVHPTDDTLTFVETNTWKKWREEDRDRPMIECVKLLNGLQDATDAKISRAANDCALRFFAASCGMQDAQNALHETAVFALLPHVVDGVSEQSRCLGETTPEYYNYEIAKSSLSRHSTT